MRSLRKRWHAMTIVTFTSIAGVPISPSPRKIGDAFLAKLDAAFEDLWARCPWGQASKIVHMGAYVDRPDPKGIDRHAQARAIDIGSVRWEPGRGQLTVRAGDPAMGGEGVGAIAMARYLAVTAVFELHLGCALNYWQPDGKHRSHWHLDDHREPGWNAGWLPSVRFLQAALRYVWGAEGLAIDGVMGPKTRAALGDVDFGAAEQVWPEWLEETARRGFAL